MNLEELREYCLSLAHTTEDTPFDEDILVFRVCNRMFTLTSSEIRPLRASLRCDPERAIELREQYPDRIVTSYHLNRKHWNTVSLEDLLLTLIKEMTQHSYNQVLAKVPRREREMSVH